MTDEPIENVCVERHRNDWFLKNFTFAPGLVTTYFDSSNRTDQAGTIIYKGDPKEDKFVLHIPTNMPWATPLYVKIDGIEIKMDVRAKNIKPPSQDDINKKAYYYVSTWKNKKTLSYSLTLGDRMYHFAR